MKLALNHYRILGDSGLRVSPLCLGTMTFGDLWGWGATKRVCQQIFDTYLESGGNFIDTANYYTDGASETYIGEFIKGCRKQFVISSKYSLHMQPGNPNSCGNHRKNMVESLEESLKRLHTDYIDIYWLDSWGFRTRIEEVMRAFDDLIRQGKILYIGVSNTPAWKIAEANSLAKARGWTPFSAVQIHYNLAERSAEHEFFPMAREMGLALLPWGSLAGGVLTGKYKKEMLAKGGLSIDTKRLDMVRSVNQLTSKNLDIADVLQEIAYEMKATPAQVALRWLLGQEDVTSPILGARTYEQFRENLGCLELEITDRHRSWLDECGKPEPIYPGNYYETSLYKRVMNGDTIFYDRGP